MCAVRIPDGSAELLSHLETAQTESCALKPPQRSCLQHTAFGFQLLYIHILPNSASTSRLDSHTSRKIYIYIKTRGFKPFRDTYLQSAISQSLLNHILTKKRGWGGGGALQLPITSHESLLARDFQLAALDFVRVGVCETRCPRHTSNSIGKRVPGKRGWL